MTSAASHRWTRPSRPGGTSRSVKDREGRYLLINRRYEELFHVRRDEVLGKTDYDLVPPEAAAAFRENDRRILEAEAPVEFEETAPQEDGVHTYISIKFPIRDASGRAYAVGGISTDITPRKRALQALKASEERFALAMRGASDGLWDWDLRTNEVYFSPRWKAMLGYEDHEVRNRFDEWESRVHPDDLERARATIRDYLEGRTHHYELEHRLRHRDGSHRWILARGVARFDEEGRPYRMAGSHVDVTERRRAEEQLIQAAKLSSLGETVAGVAHEVNNPLAFVSNNAAVLQRDLREVREVLDLCREAEEVLAAHAPDRLERLRERARRADLDRTLDEMEELLARSREGLKRIERIVSDLRSFARLEEGELQPLDLNPRIESTVHIAATRAKRKGVEVELDLAPLPPLSGHPERLDQVVMNLLANAIDACQAGGRVTVRTRAGRGEVEVHVLDTGRGIEPSARERIFDPFFTTKPPGEGTGLGLSISYGIVRDHGGRIECRSEPGRGSHFVVYLPVAPP